MINNKIYWTLRNNCSKNWENKFNKLNWTVLHNPIINLQVNSNFNLIGEKILNQNNIIISSPFAAENVIKKIKQEKIKCYTVGYHSASILKRNNLKVEFTANNSEDLAEYITANNNNKYLHLCSEKSNSKIWPKNVESFPIYKPILNENFNITKNSIKSKSIIVFGSPSGVNEWYTKNTDIKNSVIATMGKTTKNQCALYYNNTMIIPINSSTDELCESIYKFLKDN